jgi:imidazolonepropionase-like amidohydrolase
MKNLTLLLIFLSTHALAETTIINAAGYVDVVQGKLIQPVTLVIENSVIVAVNPNKIPAGENIDLSELTLLPGLIDSHVHLGSFQAPGGQLRGVTETPAALAIRAVEHAKLTLLAGFTTVRNVGSRYFVDVELSKFSDREEIVAPRIIPAAHTISITGGHGDNGGYSPFVVDQDDYRSGVADGVEDITRAVRYQIKHGAKVIKFTATAGVLSFEEAVGAQQFTAAEMQAIVDEAKRHGLKVAAHAHGSDGILAAVKAGVDSIEHGSMLNQEIIREMKKRGTYLVPTSYIGDVFDFDAVPPLLQEKARFVIPIMLDSLSMAIRENVNIAFGTDAGVIPHGSNAGEFNAMVKRGMSRADAIRTATINAADLLGVKDRGQLQAGLLADIIAVQGNPLDDINVLTDVRFVMKGGKVYVPTAQR